MTRPGTTDGAATLQARTRHREVTDEGDCGDGSGCGKGRDAPPLSPLYSFCNKGVLFVQKIAANGNCRTTQLSQKRAQSTPQRTTEFYSFQRATCNRFNINQLR